MRARPHVRAARRGHLRRLPPRAARPRRPPLPLPVRQLHQLRPPVHDHDPAALRPAQHHDGRLRRCAPACAAEYHDPADRRFHAQPVACPACGPRLWFEGDGDRVDGSDAVARRPPSGRWPPAPIVAVKGLGGYHLACDARSTGGGRRRCGGASTGRHKPFAVMVRDLADRPPNLAAVDGAEAALLAGPQRPDRPAAGAGRRGVWPPRVAPGNPLVGVLLPYTPLHHLLFGPVPAAGDAVPPDVLVMTSGNLSDEPICYDDADARDRLGDVADAWLVHDRPIHVPCDDSVVRVVDGDELPIRRSRGYAPLPVRLPFAARPGPGGRGRAEEHLLPGLGARRLAQPAHRRHGQRRDARRPSSARPASSRRCTACRPDPAAADAHPGYHSRRWAERAGRRVAWRWCSTTTPTSRR